MATKLCVICGQKLKDKEYCSFCEKLLKRERNLQKKLKAVDNILRNRYKYGVEMAKLKEARQEKEEYFLFSSARKTEYVKRKCEECGKVCTHRILLKWHGFQSMICLCCRNLRIEKRR